MWARSCYVHRFLGRKTTWIPAPLLRSFERAEPETQGISPDFEDSRQGRYQRTFERWHIPFQRWSGANHFRSVWVRRDLRMVLNLQEGPAQFVRPNEGSLLMLAIATNAILQICCYSRASQPAICPCGNRTISSSWKLAAGFHRPARWTAVVFPRLMRTGSTTVAAPPLGSSD